MYFSRNLFVLAFLAFIIAVFGLYILCLRYARKRVLRRLYQPTTCFVEWNEIEKLRDIYVSTLDGRWSYDRPIFTGENINVWYGNWYPHRPVILYFHGNSLNISYREYMAKLASMMKLNLVLVDYRGYGRSDGRPTSRGVLKDADTAMKFLLNQRSPSDIIVWGESLGGSPACYIASKYKRVSKLVLFSTFESLHSLLTGASSTTKRLLFAIARLATVDINTDTNNSKFLRGVECPVLVIHSKNDTLIPYSNAVSLAKAVRGKCNLVRIDGDHGTPRFDVATVTHLLEFVEADYDSPEEIVKFINCLTIAHDEAASSDGTN